MELQIQDEAVVDEFLDVERNLSAVDGLVAGEANLDGDVHAHVVVRMSVEIQGSGKQGGGIDEQIHLRQVAKARRARGSLDSRGLIRRQMLHGLTVVRLLAHIRDDVVP